MIIDLKTISHGSRDFDFSLEPDWWQGYEEDDQVFGPVGSLRVHISISSAGSKYVVDGSLYGKIRVRCDRCLGLYNRDLEFDFRSFLSRSPYSQDQSEVKLSAEDMSISFTEGDEIDLNDIIREQIYLSLPMKLICKDKCSGLCPVCGTNLNKNKCECQQDHGHPEFSKLKNLKIKGE